MECQKAIAIDQCDYRYKGIKVNVWHPVTHIWEYYLNLNISLITYIVMD